MLALQNVYFGFEFKNYTLEIFEVLFNFPPNSCDSCSNKHLHEKTLHDFQTKCVFL